MFSIKYSLLLLAIAGMLVVLRLGNQRVTSSR